MTQSLDQLQTQLVGVQQSFGLLSDRVKKLEGDPDDPPIRLDFMNMSLDNQRGRMDRMSNDAHLLKETVDVISGHMETPKAMVDWQMGELQKLREQIQDPKFAQTPERRSELKYLTRQKGFQNLQPYNGGTSTQLG